MQVASRGTNVTHADMSLLQQSSEPLSRPNLIQQNSVSGGILSTGCGQRTAIVLCASPERYRPRSFFILDGLEYGLEHT